MKKIYKKKRKGITYVEAIISVLIVGIMVVAIFSVLPVIKSLNNKSDEYIKIENYIGNTSEKMHADLNNGIDITDGVYLNEFTNEDFVADIYVQSEEILNNKYYIVEMVVEQIDTDLSVDTSFILKEDINVETVPE